MRTLMIALSEDRKPIKLHFPGVGKNMRKFQKLLEFVDYFKTSLFFLFLTLLPFSGFMFSSVNEESSSFAYVISSLVFISGLYLFNVVLSSNKRLIDPEGLFIVLVFALLTTAAAVLVTPSSAANTFGSEGSDSIKSLSGLGIISFLLIFYFISLFNKTIKTQKFLLNTLIFGTTLLSLFYIFGLSKNSDDPENTRNVLVILLSFTLSFYSLLRTRNWLFLFASIINFIALITTPVNETYLFTFSIIAFIASLPVTIIFFATESNLIGDIYDDLMESSKKLGETPQIFKFLLSLLQVITMYSFMIFAGIAIYLFINDQEVINVFKFAFEDLEASFNLIKDDVKILLIGNGTGELSLFVEYSNSIKSNISLFALILEGQGLVGIFAYLILFLSPLYLGFKNFINLKNSSIKEFNYLYISIVFFLFLISFFLYPGYLVISFFWIFSTAIYVLKSLKNKKNLPINLDELYATIELKFFRKSLGSKSLYVRFIISLILLIISFILTYSILNLVNDLI